MVKNFATPVLMPSRGVNRRLTGVRHSFDFDNSAENQMSTELTEADRPYKVFRPLNHQSTYFAIYLGADVEENRVTGERAISGEQYKPTSTNKLKHAK
jgi:hypothetical protein